MIEEDFDKMRVGKDVIPYWENKMQKQHLLQLAVKQLKRAVKNKNSIYRNSLLKFI